MILKRIEHHFEFLEEDNKKICQRIFDIERGEKESEMKYENIYTRLESEEERKKKDFIAIEKPKPSHRYQSGKGTPFVRISIKSFKCQNLLRSIQS